MSLPNRSSSASLEPQQCSAGPADATADSPTATLSALARPASGSSASTAQEELSDGGSAENAAAEAVAAEADANGVSIFMNEHYDGCMDEDSPGKKKASGEESQG